MCVATELGANLSEVTCMQDSVNRDIQGLTGTLKYLQGFTEIKTFVDTNNEDELCIGAQIALTSAKSYSEACLLLLECLSF